MINRSCALTLTAVLVVLLTSRAQTSPHTPAKDDYSQELAVIEEMSTKIAFDNDGNLTRDQASRVRVQTDAGVKQWGLLSFPYQSLTQTVQIDYVRVLKADGSTVITPPDNVQDLDSEITRTAPFYSDLREKHVAVKGLGKGEILEYEAHWRTTKPLTPGQFWFQYSFHHDGIVLDERLEIKVPGDRLVKVKGPQATQTVTTDGGSRVYAWTYSKLQSVNEPKSDQKKATEAALGRLPPPDVQISSFQSWEDVGRWYWNLQNDRTEPTLAIRAKAAELTKGMTDDESKLRVLYSFVSTQYRYIGIAFGIGRYQPHAADDVLTNNYGDCKDKQTLLASLLRASGITLYPALVNSGWTIDAEVPSPGQFDHVIGYLPQGKKVMWLDTTPEVAPFGYLVPRLRDKQALVVSGEKSIQLVTTPADPPFPSTQMFKIDGTLSDDGKFEAKIESSARGDYEVLLREAFRQVAQPQWKDLMQGISYGLGFAGTVSDVSASMPEAISEPFHFSYSYDRKDYPDWDNHQFTVPGLPFYMPPVNDNAKYPIWLGSPQESVSDSKVKLPVGYKPQPPSNVELNYDFAEYHAFYSEDQGVLIAKRQLLIKLQQVPVEEFDTYRKFLKNVQNDVNQYVQTSSFKAIVTPKPVPVPAMPTGQPPGAAPSLLGEAVKLPASDSSQANQLEADAYTAVRRGDHPAALTAFKRAVEADPKFMRARLELAAGYMASGMTDSALEALRQAVASDRQNALARRAYISVLVSLHRTDEAIDATREAVKVAPDDPDANSGLGTLLMMQKRYSEAVPYLEVAARGDTSPGSQARLGSAYLRAGQIEKGTTILQKVADANPKAMMLNDIAYDFAEADAHLDKALEYAQHAVAEAEGESRDIDLSNLLTDDLACVQKLAYFWDTLGWVHFHLGHLDLAESYVRASWVLSQSGLVGDHLGQIYEQQKKTEKAIHVYRLALAAPDAKTSTGSADETRQRLEHLTGEKVAPKGPGEEASASELSVFRSAKLKQLVPGSARAEFFLLFSPGPKVEDVKFISGSGELQSIDQALSDANFQVAFPEAGSARLLRRAIVTCSSDTGCEAVLLPPDSVTSVD